jgi:hypothetical protein
VWWRVDVPPGRPTTTIDIVTYRRAGTSDEWDSVPITVPVEVRSGGWVLLPSGVDGLSGTYELVVAWTQHAAAGDVTGSGSFVVRDGHGVVARPAAVAGRGWILAGVAAAVMLVIAGAMVVWQLFDDPDADEPVAEPAPATTSAPPNSPATTDHPTPTTAAVASTTPSTPAPTTEVTTNPATTPSTSGGSTVVTTTPSTTPSTSAGSTSSLPTTTLPVGPRVVIDGRVEDCRFGADCLIAAFEIERFETQPRTYVCEFSDGSRVTFTFGGSGVSTACSQAGPAPAITIEVDGVRSDTITRDTVAAA